MATQYIILISLLSITHLSQANFLSLWPTPAFVAGLGGEATFTCVSSKDNNNIHWLLNGTNLSDLPLANVTHGFEPKTFTATLQIINIPPSLNNTRIQCIANTTNGYEEAQRSSTLFVQGLLSDVQSLNASLDGNCINLHWTPPFSLPLTLYDPDITYCVDVTTSSAKLHSECGIAGTEFSYHSPSGSFFDEYTFTVTPINVVGNGTRRSIQFSASLPTKKEVSTTQSTTRLTSTMSVQGQLNSLGSLVILGAIVLVVIVSIIVVAMIKHRSYEDKYTILGLERGRIAIFAKNDRIISIKNDLENDYCMNEQN